MGDAERYRFERSGDRVRPGPMGGSKNLKNRLFLALALSMLLMPTLMFAEETTTESEPSKTVTDLEHAAKTMLENSSFRHTDLIRFIAGVTYRY